MARRTRDDEVGGLVAESLPPGEYDGLICVAAAMRAVAMTRSADWWSCCLSQPPAPHALRPQRQATSYTLFTLYSRLYNRLGELCKRAQPSGASSHDAHDVIWLTRSKAAVWTVDDMARLIDFLKESLFILP